MWKFLCWRGLKNFPCTAGRDEGEGKGLRGRGWGEEVRGREGEWYPREGQGCQRCTKYGRENLGFIWFSFKKSNPWIFET